MTDTIKKPPTKRSNYNPLFTMAALNPEPVTQILSLLLLGRTSKAEGDMRKPLLMTAGIVAIGMGIGLVVLKTHILG